MRKSDGSYENLELSVIFAEGSWELPNQVGSWKYSVDRHDYDTHTSGSLDYHLKDSKKGILPTLLTTIINCNMRNTKSNYLGVKYPSISADNPNAVIVLDCRL